MKTIIFTIIIFSTITSCATDSPIEVGYEDILLEEEIILDTALIVRIDPRIELLSIVQHFTTWANQGHTKYESRYKYYVDKHFKRFVGHDAIKLSQELTNSGFTFDAPVSFVLFHSNPPAFEQEVPYSNHLIARAGSKEKLEEFANALRDFAEDTEFIEFLETQKTLFRKIENDIKRTIGGRDYIETVEEYYGQKQRSYNIIPAPLIHEGGYGPAIETDEGKNVYSICGPASSSNGIPNFGDELYFSYIMLHEFSHSFVDPLTERYIEQVSQYSHLYEPIREQMKNMAYRNWEICFNEHLVRTNVARLANILQGTDAKNKILKQEYDQGFIYIYGLDSLMQNYESNRIDYPAYGDFYPEFIEYLATIE